MLFFAYMPAVPLLSRDHESRLHKKQCKRRMVKVTHVKPGMALQADVYESRPGGG